MNKNNLLIIIISFLIILVGSYGGFEYYKISKFIKEADQFTRGEKYEEAIKKLSIAQISWFVKDLGIGKEEILDKKEENSRLISELSKYNQGLDRFDEEYYQEAIGLFLEIPEDSFYSNDAKLKIEEAKRKIIEKELGETKLAKKEAEKEAQQEAIKRSQAETKIKQEEAAKVIAEQKAKQEELGRKLKEQQLIEKETEEKRMNTDNDSDGLTYRRELELGTSDWNVDSDGDGINDKDDIHPTGGGRNVAQTFTWSYGGYTWNWTESIQEDWYEYYRAKPRSSPESVKYITSSDPFIKKISEAITKGEEKGVERVWLAISFVQSLPYVKDVYTGYDEYPKYPIETFFEKNGDCEDTSYLAASIINAMNRGVVLILLPGHMAVGIYMNCDTPGTYYEIDGRCYYYIETTSKDWAAGEIPDRYRDVTATLIQIPSGRTNDVYPTYKKPCNYSSDFSAYFDGRNFYTDSQCNIQAHCLLYKGYYVNPQITAKLYWDSGCTQKVLSYCSKSIYYPGYFFNSIDGKIYTDYQCTQKEADLQ